MICLEKILYNHESFDSPKKSLYYLGGLNLNIDENILISRTKNQKIIVTLKSIPVAERLTYGAIA
jgi:hypothetical protein